MNTLSRVTQASHPHSKAEAAGIYLLVGTVLATICYGAAVGGEHWFAGALSSALLAGAPLALGVLIGFLFGIPRVQLSGDGAGVGDSSPTPAGVGYQVNTNLEQISDWLTKLLIGIGLTQIMALPAAIESVAEFSARGLGQKSNEGVVAAILIFFAIAGFLIGYNMTRLVLGPAIRAIEQPRSAVVARVVSAPALATRTLERTIDPKDAGELLRFSMTDLRTPEQYIAWGRAKFEYDLGSEEAVEALQRAAELAPGDRRAIESLMLAALYLAPPRGYRLAIEYAQRYLGTSRTPSAAEANLYAFLACAYGQAHRYAVETQGAPDTIEGWRKQAVDAIRTTLTLDKRWLPALVGLTHPPITDGENDLESLNNDPAVKELLKTAPSS